MHLVPKPVPEQTRPHSFQMRLAANHDWESTEHPSVDVKFPETEILDLSPAHAPGPGGLHAAKACSLRFPILTDGPMTWNCGLDPVPEYKLFAPGRMRMLLAGSSGKAAIVELRG